MARLDDDMPAGPRTSTAAAADQPPAPTGSGLENAALRSFTDLVARLFTPDREALLARLAPEFSAEDRRSVVSDQMTTRDAWVDLVLEGLEVFDAIAIDEVIALRGDRLALVRSRWVGTDGFDVPYLGVGEVDADGRPCALVTFDPDDLVAAVEELEARYFAGEGARYAAQVRSGSAHSTALFARDWDALGATMAENFVAVDHRGLWPELDRDGYLARMRTLTEQASDTTIVNRTSQVAGSEAFSICDVRGTRDHGDSYTYCFHLVSVTNEAGQLALAYHKAS